MTQAQEGLQVLLDMAAEPDMLMRSGKQIEWMRLSESGKKETPGAETPRAVK